MSIVCHLKMHTVLIKCLWLAVCVNYSADFYCKIALINRFKLYLIKTQQDAKKNKKQTKRKQKQRRRHVTHLG